MPQILGLAICEATSQYLGLPVEFFRFTPKSGVGDKLSVNIIFVFTRDQFSLNLGFKKFVCAPNELVFEAPVFMTR